MKANITLELYDESKDSFYLALLLREFSIEVFGEARTPNVIDFVNAHNAGIYMIKHGDACVGFTSFMINEYFGLREPIVANTYMFIKKRYRRTKAMHLIAIQSARVCEHFNMPLEHYYAADSKSQPFIGRMKGELIYNAYEYPVDVVVAEATKLENKVKVKND